MNLWQIVVFSFAFGLCASEAQAKRDVFSDDSKLRRCQLFQIQRLDDETSSADVIAKAVAQRCQKEVPEAISEPASSEEIVADVLEWRAAKGRAQRYIKQYGKEAEAKAQEMADTLSKVGTRTDARITTLAVTRIRELQR